MFYSLRVRVFSSIAMLILFCGTTFTAWAQDTIITRAGKEILVRVVEVNPADVVYRRFDYPEGPLFHITKSEINMIRYQSGSIDTFNLVTLSPVERRLIEMLDDRFYLDGKRLSQAQLEHVIIESGYKRAVATVNEMRKLRSDSRSALVMGFIAGSTGVSLLLPAYLLMNINSGSDFVPVLSVLGGSLSAIGVVSIIRGFNDRSLSLQLNMKAVEYYNAGVLQL